MVAVETLTRGYAAGVTSFMTVGMVVFLLLNRAILIDIKFEIALGIDLFRL